MSPSSRKDSKGRVLRTGECQRKDGTYEYRLKNRKRINAVLCMHLR